MSDVPEPWLRGPLADVHPLVMPVFFSFAQVREDLARHITGLPSDRVWQTFGNMSLGFHLKHIAGSVDRLGTYLIGGQLNENQLESLQQEHEPESSLPELLKAIHDSLAVCEMRLRQLRPTDIFDARTVGRQHLPTTVLGLLVHLAEHTQRHLGQAITLAQILRSQV